jgi:hypothetical protein
MAIFGTKRPMTVRVRSQGGNLPTDVPDLASVEIEGIRFRVEDTPTGPVVVAQSVEGDDLIIRPGACSIIGLCVVLP